MKWTKEEEQFLIDNYVDKGAAYCTEKFNRSYASVKQKASRLNLTKTGWSKQEEQFLIENYAEQGPAYCSEKLNRTYESVTLKARKLNLTKAGWSKQEEQFLIDNYADRGPAYCAEKLNRTYASVAVKAGYLNLTKNLIKIDWCEKEVQFLIENYAEQGPAYCAKQLNRSYKSVTGKAEKLNLQANTKYSSNTVYAIYFPELFLYKIGITNNVERRIKEFGQPCVILKTKECATYQEAAELERMLLKSVTLIDTGALNNGNSETFMQPSELIEKFLGF